MSINGESWQYMMIHMAHHFYTEHLDFFQRSINVLYYAEWKQKKTSFAFWLHFANPSFDILSNRVLALSYPQEKIEWKNRPAHPTHRTSIISICAQKKGKICSLSSRVAKPCCWATLHNTHIRIEKKINFKRILQPAHEAATTTAAVVCCVSFKACGVAHSS